MRNHKVQDGRQPLDKDGMNCIEVARINAGNPSYYADVCLFSFKLNR